VCVWLGEVILLLCYGCYWGCRAASRTLAGTMGWRPATHRTVVPELRARELPHAARIAGLILHRACAPRTADALQSGCARPTPHTDHPAVYLPRLLGLPGLPCKEPTPWPTLND
jgi:hypothetical protein